MTLTKSLKRAEKMRRRRAPIIERRLRRRGAPKRRGSDSALHPREEVVEEE
jgi:hypothetical protein